MSLELSDVFMVNDQRTARVSISIDDQKITINFPKGAPSIEHKRSDLVEVESTETAHPFKLTFAFPKTFIRLVGVGQSTVNDVEKWCNKVNVPFISRAAAITGRSWGDIEIEHGLASLRLDDKVHFDYPLQQIKQITKQSNYDLDVALKTNPAVKDDVHELCSIRYYVPPTEYSTETAVELQGRFEEHAGFLQTDRSAFICQLNDLQLAYPSGKYTFGFTENHLNLSNNKKFDYNIEWSHVKRLFLLDDAQSTGRKLLLVGLEPGFKQGNKSYTFITIVLPDGPTVDLHLNASDDDFTNKWHGKLSSTMPDTMQNLVPTLLSAFSTDRIYGPDNSFKSYNQESFVQAYNKSNEGSLYMMKRGLMYVKNPTTYIRYDDIKEIRFDQLDDGTGAFASRTFNLVIEVKQSKTKMEFVSIVNENFDSMYTYFDKNNIPMRDSASLKRYVGRLSTASNMKSMQDRQDDAAARKRVQQLKDQASEDDDEDDEDFTMDDEESSEDDYSDDSDSGKKSKKSSKKDKKEKKSSKKDKKDKKDKKKRDRTEDADDAEAITKKAKKQKTKAGDSGDEEVSLMDEMRD